MQRQPDSATLQQVLDVLEEIAPTRYAEPWDNVGLLVGDPAQSVTSAMLAIDYTPAVAAEAQQAGCNLIVAYHPPIFEPLKRIGPASLIADALRRGVAIYSPHTALDVADGGTNDMLADALGLKERRPLRLAEGKPRQCKLVVFVPPEALDNVSRALFDAGAGWIGNYSCCSFRSLGTGTFFGQAGASPAVGQAGRLEQTSELRLETVVPLDRVADVTAALRAAHPYEEPAFDLVPLLSLPEQRGMGRIGEFAVAVERSEVLARLKHALGLAHLLVAGPATGPIRSAAACAGACGDLFVDAMRQGAELYLTGEMRHHDALKAAGAGMTVVCTLHSNSERAALSRLAQRIAEKLPKLDVRISAADRDPFSVT